MTNGLNNGFFFILMYQTLGLINLKANVENKIFFFFYVFIFWSSSGHVTLRIKFISTGGPDDILVIKQQSLQEKLCIIQNAAKISSVQFTAPLILIVCHNNIYYSKQSLNIIRVIRIFLLIFFLRCPSILALLIWPDQFHPPRLHAHSYLCLLV